MHADTSHKNGQRGEQNLLDLGVRRRESRKKEVKGGFLYPWERGERSWKGKNIYTDNSHKNEQGGGNKACEIWG